MQEALAQELPVAFPGAGTTDRANPHHPPFSGASGGPSASCEGTRPSPGFLPTECERVWLPALCSHGSRILLMMSHLPIFALSFSLVSFILKVVKECWEPPLPPPAAPQDQGQSGYLKAVPGRPPSSPSPPAHPSRSVPLWSLIISRGGRLGRAVLLCFLIRYSCEVFLGLLLRGLCSHRQRRERALFSVSAKELDPNGSQG